MTHSASDSPTVPAPQTQAAPASGLAARAAGVERMLGRGLDAALATLLAAEVILLFAGVIARYVFRHSLIWSDELSELLFLWLSMLGAASASRRAAHMRMSALLHFVGERHVPFLEGVAELGALLFLGAILVPALSYAQAQVIITMPALSISDAWRAAALPAGVVLMLVLTALKLLQGRLRRLILPAVLLGAVTGILAATGGWLETLGAGNLVLFFVVIFAASVFLSIPIAFAFGLATMGYLVFTTPIPPVVVIGRINEGMNSPLLLAVPLFVFLGYLVQMTGLAAAMVNFLASLLGHVRGGLHYALIAALYLMSGISGSKAADMAAVAPVLFPEMKRRGNNQGRMVALLAATGAQTETVPPSIVLITIGSVANVSVAALFTGGMLPAAVLGVVLCLVVWAQARKEVDTRTPPAGARVVLRALVTALPALVLPLVIRLAVVEGVATATEVATIGIVYSILASVIFFGFRSPRALVPILIEAGTLSGAILIVIGVASSMAWALTQSGFAALLSEVMQQVPGGRVGFLIASAVTFMVIGTVLEGIPAMVLFGPLLFPIARELGVNEVHYAIVVVIAMGMGLFSPPFGVGYYIASTIGEVRPDLGMRPILPFVLALALGLLVLILVPWLSIGFL